MSKLFVAFLRVLLGYQKMKKRITPQCIYIYLSYGCVCVWKYPLIEVLTLVQGFTFSLDSFGHDLVHLRVRLENSGI